MRYNLLGHNRSAGENVSLDAALVVPPQNPEEAVVSPLRTVCDVRDPVGSVWRAVHSPTQNPDRLCTVLCAVNVSVDPTFILLDISIECHYRLNWPVGHDFPLNRCHIVRNFVVPGSKMEVRCKTRIVSGLASIRTCRDRVVRWTVLIWTWLEVATRCQPPWLSRLTSSHSHSNAVYKNMY